MLFSGTLRLNLDPFDSHTDEELWKILELSHLKNFVSGLEQGLLHPVSEGGENLRYSLGIISCFSVVTIRRKKTYIVFILLGSYHCLHLSECPVVIAAVDTSKIRNHDPYSSYSSEKVHFHIRHLAGYGHPWHLNFHLLFSYVLAGFHH